MKLERSLACIDIEATGPDPAVDRIVELALVVLYPDGSRKSRCARFNPGIPIPAEASAVHGITDDMVVNCPRFADRAAQIHQAIQGRDLAGYNLMRFDLPILDEELRRCGLKLDLATVRVIDCFTIFAKKEPRDLSAAVQKFCGREHAGAHGALADADATLDVLEGQLAAYPDLSEMSVADLHEFSRRDGDRQPADLAGKLYFKNGVLHYAIGQCRDKPVSHDTSFGEWMMKKDFPGSTKEYLRAELDRIYEIRRAEMEADGVPYRR